MPCMTLVFLSASLRLPFVRADCICRLSEVPTERYFGSSARARASCSGSCTFPGGALGFSAVLGVLVLVGWGVRTFPSLESTLRIATLFIASPFLGVSLFLGVARWLDPFETLGPFKAGDLKGGAREVEALATLMVSSGTLARFAAGSLRSGSAGRFLLILVAGVLTARLEAIGTSSSDPDSSLAREEGACF